MPLKQTLARNIKELRKRHKLTARGLAAAIDVSPTTLVQIEKGRTSTNLEIIERLAKQLDVHPAALLGGLNTGSSREELIRFISEFVASCDDTAFESLSIAFEARRAAQLLTRGRK